MEIKLSNRMQCVSDLVTKGRIADIGCDHAFVSIYLLQSKKADKVLAMDIKDGPLNIARENIALYGFEEYIEVRKSNGFEAARVSEVDCAIIAGMGGHLIIDILKRGSEFTDNGIELILQPQSDIPLVREYLFSIGYMICEEKMLIEEGKYYTIIKATKSDSVKELSVEEIKFGPCLLKEKNTVLHQYLNHKLEKNKDIIFRLNNKKDGQNERITELNQENQMICSVLDKYFI